MALEFSEIAMLGCMFYKKKDLLKASESTENLVSFVNSVKKMVDSTDKIKFGSSKAAFVKAMNPAVEEVLDDFCRGISGAIATKEWLTRHHNEPADTVIMACLSRRKTQSMLLIPRSSTKHSILLWMDQSLMRLKKN